MKLMLNGDIRNICESSSYHANDGYDEEILKTDFDNLKV